MAINELLNKYEAIDNEVTKIRNAAQRETIELDIAKKELATKKAEIEAGGITFNTPEELEIVLQKNVAQLESVLDSTERKLQAI